MQSFAEYSQQAQQILRRNFQLEDDGLHPRHPIFQYFRRIFGPYLPVFTYLALLLILSVLGSLPPITAIFPDAPVPVTTEPDVPSYDVSEANSTLTETGAKNKPTDDGSLSWFFPTVLSLLFLYSMFIVLRIIRTVALSRQLQNGPTPNQARLNQLFTQLSLSENNRDRNNANNWRSRLRLALVNRDFTGEDYEVLMRLDEEVSNGRRGANEAAINRLPLHKISQPDIESKDDDLNARNLQCPICLAPYECGDDVRTVLCMHQFHKDCIDPWLRTNGTCPVCKSRATE